MAWGTSPNSDERITLKSEMADYLKGLNSTGEISYETYNEAFDFTLELLDKMYALGIKHSKE